MSLLKLRVCNYTLSGKLSKTNPMAYLPGSKTWSLEKEDNPIVVKVVAVAIESMTGWLREERLGQPTGIPMYRHYGT